MKDLAHSFCREMLESGVLLFGDFTLKSGRQSPYFFQLGEMFTNSVSLTRLGELYATGILEQGLQDSFDVFFGSAYKGIPIAIATATALQRKGYPKEVSFNRKEEKAHGEGGLLIGAELAGKRVLIVDDVITDGTEKQHSAKLVRANGGRLFGILIGLNRADIQLKQLGSTYYLEETGTDNLIPIYSLAHLDDVVSFIRNSDQFDDELAQAMLAYRHSLTHH